MARHTGHLFHNKGFNNPEAMKLFVEAQHGVSKDSLMLMANMEPWSSENSENWILDALRIGQHMGTVKVTEDFMKAFDMKFESVFADKDLMEKLGLDLDDYSD